MPCSCPGLPRHAPALPLPCLLSFSLSEKSLLLASMGRRDSPGKARHDAGRVCLGLALALPRRALVPALLCPLSFSINEESLFTVYIERRDSRDKARHDTGRFVLPLPMPLPCFAHCHCLAFPCPLSFFLNEESLFIVYI